MSRGWIVVLVIIIAAGGLGAVLYERHVKALEAEIPKETYDFTTITSDVVQSVASTGSVVSKLDIAIKCRAGGEITGLPFDDVAMQVKKDEVLIQIDQTDEKHLDQADAMLEQSKDKELEAEQLEKQGELDLETAKETADANILAAKVKAENLQKTADRQKQLLDKNLAAPQDYESAQTDASAAASALSLATIAKEELKSQAVALDVKKNDVKLAQSQVRLDQSAYDEANTNLGYCTVRAPRDGVISALSVQLGGMMQSALSVGSTGTAVMTLSDLSQLFILADVDESDIGGIQADQEVVMTADSFPGVKFGGKVIRVATQGVNTSNVVTFEVKIEVTSQNKSLLKPSMTTNVQIIEATKKGGIVVPIQAFAAASRASALAHKDHKAHLTVVKPDGSTEDRTVVLGINDGSYQEVVSGLAVNEAVQVHKNQADSRWAQGNQQGRGGPPVGVTTGGRR